MQDEKLCPICKNHCSLTKPKCGRGKKYAETIELPIKSNDKDKKSKHIYKLKDYEKSNIDENLSKMEDSGLIKRTDSKKDKRSMDIKLTKEGKKEAVLAGAQMASLHSEMFSCLNITEKEQFLSILEKLSLDWDSRYLVKN